jgi:hypothetical protein
MHIHNLHPGQPVCLTLSQHKWAFVRVFSSRHERYEISHVRHSPQQNARPSPVPEALRLPEFSFYNFQKIIDYRGCLFDSFPVFVRCVMRAIFLNFIYCRSN